MSALRTESSPEASSATAIFDEAPRPADEMGLSSGCLLAAIVVLLPAFLYFGVFAVLLIDNSVMRTKFFSREYLSQEVIYGTEILYAPLIFLVRLATSG